MTSTTDCSLMICGQAGQGMQTLGVLFTQAILRQGLYLSTYQSYHSRIRGGHNYFQLRLSSQPVYSVATSVDILVALDDYSLQAHCQELSDRSVILYDASRSRPGTQCAQSLGLDIPRLFPPAQQEEIYATSVFAGAIARLLGLDPQAVVKIIHTSLGKKSETVIRENLAAFQAGQEFIRQHPEWEDRYRLAVSASGQDPLALHGNQALALGALAAGCKFYSAYPMTPSTSVLDTMAGAVDQAGLVVEQAEDEIAALNMVLGASYAGVRAMTGTSGGGFALMVETLSLAGILECPAVIVNAQRPGPATGLPTRTEQGDLEFVIHAGHGEFPKAVLAPGNHAQCFALAAQAFNLADKYQIPVVILTDQYLADLYQNVLLADLKAPAIDRGKLVESREDYQRYEITPDGVSPRALPGKGEGLVVADSDEHTEDGHLTEDLQVRARMNEKRLRKYQGLRADMLLPDVYGAVSQTALVCWGSNLGVCREAAEVLSHQGIPLAMVHFQQLWPWNKEKIKGLLAAFKNLICVENNATGQLARLLWAEAEVPVSQQVLKSNGLPFFLDELVAAVKARLEKA